MYAPPNKKFEVEYRGEHRSELTWVMANTAYDAVCKAFPRLHPSDSRIVCREVPTAESVKERQEAKTIRPPTPYLGPSRETLKAAHIACKACQEYLACERQAESGLPTSRLHQEVETVRPPANDDDDATFWHWGVRAGPDPDWAAHENRIRDMGIRVASRLRRELFAEALEGLDWKENYRWMLDLLYATDAMAGDR
jgi:hypothetical protein